MKSRRKHSFQFMTILYFVIVFCMCVSRFNVIMTIMGGQLTRVEEINLLPFHSVRENLQYGRNPISWDMLYNMVMFVPFGIIYCYYQKHFRVYKAVGMSCLTTFFIESAQFILKTGVVDIDDFIVNTLGSLMGIMVYVILQHIYTTSPSCVWSMMVLARTKSLYWLSQSNTTVYVCSVWTKP